MPHVRAHRWWARSILAALAVLLLLPALAQADSIPALGVNDLRSDGILVRNADYNGAGDLDLYSAAGGRLYRGRMRLDCVDPAFSGTFDFKAYKPGCHGVNYDDLVGALARRNITYLPILINFGNAAGTSDRPVPPTADGAGGTPTRTEFAAFAAAAARRYGPGGAFWASCGCPPHPIQAWEIWNEENNGWWWADRADPADYAAMFGQTRMALRNADPAARTVVGGLVWDANGQGSFVAPDAIIGALAAGNANAFDAVAIHPYTDARGQAPEQIAAAAQTYVDLAAQAVRTATGPAANGSPRQPIWITELGWSDTDTSPDVVAGALRSFLGGLDAGSRARDSVGPVLWYMLRDSGYKGGRDDQLGMRYTSVMGDDGGPKPVWDAFAQSAATGADVALPPALPDAGPYVPAPVTPPPAPAVVKATPKSATPPAARVSKVVAVRTRSGRRSLTLLLTCVRPGATCKGSARLRAKVARAARRGTVRSTTVGSRSWRVRGGRTTRVRIPVNRIGASLLRHGRRLRVQVVVTAADTRGGRAQVTAGATVR